jgi:hypothetical protein
VSLVADWRELQRELPTNWQSARLRLEIKDAARCDEAAALLGPAQPYRVSLGVLDVTTARDGSAPSPGAVERLLRRLDNKRVIGTVSLTKTQRAAPRPEVELPSLVKAWDVAIAKLPADWSDLYCELELLSSDYIERAALLCSPLNPRREGKRAALRFRAASRFGYGASAEMTRRCLDRCDREEIRGSLTILRVLSDSDPVGTQGPVWLLAGKTI